MAGVDRLRFHEGRGEGVHVNVEGESREGLPFFIGGGSPSSGGAPSAVARVPGCPVLIGWRPSPLPTPAHPAKPPPPH